jgi:hypothetical protein
MEEDCPVVNVNDRVKVYWPNEDKTTEKITAIIIKVEKCKKAKQNSIFKYTLRVESDDDCNMVNGDETTTRLLHLKWKLIKIKKIYPSFCVVKPHFSGFVPLLCGNVPDKCAFVPLLCGYVPDKCAFVRLLSGYVPLHSVY